MGNMRRIKKAYFKANSMPTKKPIYGWADGHAVVLRQVSILGDFKLMAIRSLDVPKNAMQLLNDALKKQIAATKKTTGIMGALGRAFESFKKMFGLPDNGQSRFLEKLEKEHRRR